MTGVRSTNAVISLIYLKHAHISNATNKQFESGQIVNFVQVDAERLYWICFQLSEIVQVPIVLGLSFAFSFYYFGWMFCAGLGVFIFATLINFAIGIFYNKQEKIIMRRKDRRMKVTTESINNMKMLKLYSWQDSFMQRTFRRRAKELETLRKINFGWAFVIAGIYLFPSMLPAVTFSAFVGTGHTLDFNVAAAALIIFNLMQGPLIQVPFFFSEIINLIVSMKRIEGFLDLDEVQTGIIHRENGNPEYAFSIEGNFSWGFSAKKDKTEEGAKDG